MKMSGFAQYVQEELLGDIPGISFRKMFSGYGIYKNGIIFALLLNDTLYFKVDDTNRELYKAKGCKPFSYRNKKGTEVVMPYYAVPAEVLDDREQFMEFITASFRVGEKQ